MLKIIFLAESMTKFLCQILIRPLDKMSILIIIVLSPCNHHFWAPEMWKFLLVLPKVGKFCQFSMEIWNTTFISQKNYIINSCVTLNSIKEFSSKKKTILNLQYSRKFWQNNDKIIKTAKKTENACKVEYNTKSKKKWEKKVSLFFHLVFFCSEGNI